MRSLIILSFLIFFAVQTSIAQENSNPSNNPIITRNYVITEKNAGTAFIMSLVVPGSGQMYSGKVGRGLAIFLTVPILAATGTTLMNTNTRGSGGETLKYVGGGLVITALVIHVAQLIDAPLCAREVNRKNGFAQRKIKWQLGSATEVVGLGLKARF
jgi:TM2 domain-containing membrane protein YozV